MTFENLIEEYRFLAKQAIKYVRENHSNDSDWVTITGEFGDKKGVSVLLSPTNDEVSTVRVGETIFLFRDGHSSYVYYPRSTESIKRMSDNLSVISQQMLEFIIANEIRGKK